MSSSLSVMEGKLPPGFRFHPRDDELICDYLYAKAGGASATAAGRDSYGRPSIVSVDLNKCEPWDLPESACVGEKEWYFFSLRDKKYATGQRTNRATVSGYWKATGKDRPIARDGSLVGSRKTLVFYQGRAPKGKKTEWVMHEFRIESSPAAPHKPSSKGDWVLCRAFYKSRGTSSKAARKNTGGTTETSSDDTGYSLLPPISDEAAFVSFEQHHQQHQNLVHSGEVLEHVPCFSSHLQQQPIRLVASATPPPLLHQLPQHLAGLLTPAISSYFSSLSGDKAVDAVGSIFGHLAKPDGAGHLPINGMQHVGPENQSFLSAASSAPAAPWNRF